MKTSPLQPHSVNSSLPLETVAANPQLSESDKISEASRQFEAIFLRQILSSAQKPTFPSRFSSQSFSSGIYQDMMTNQLADQISRSGTFGLAGSLERELSQQLTPNPAHDQARTPGANPALLAHAQPVPQRYDH